MNAGRKEIAFLAKFAVIFSSAEFLIFTLDFSALQVFIARTQAGLFGLQASGSRIILEKGIFDITPSCTGLVSASILGAIIFSLSKPSLGQKAYIFASGVVLLLALNYIRVLAVVWAGAQFGMDAAQLLHIASWFATSLIVLGLWYVFTKRVSKVDDFAQIL